VVAINGEDVLTKLSNERFDGVLMDIHMPVMDGYTAALAIRALSDPAKANIPIIALTASVSHNIFSKIKNAGMQDYLTKPFQTDMLHEKLTQLCKGATV
nr:response regulator [Bacteroidota bacterium]